MRLFGPALAAALVLGGCTAQLPGYPVPPPLPPETIPLPPISETALIWHPGDWVYVDGSYRYEAGRYEPRGNRGTLWTPGHWTGDRGNYVWVPGRFS